MDLKLPSLEWDGEEVKETSTVTFNGKDNSNLRKLEKSNDRGFTFMKN